MRISDWSSDVCSSDQCLGGVIGLADPVGREGVGRHDVRPRLQIGARDRLGHLGLGQREDVVIALLILRSEEHTSELQSLMRISYAVFCLKKKNKTTHHQHIQHTTKNYQ